MVSKAASPRNIDGLMSGCLVLKSFKVGSKALESASDLCSSGDFAFFNYNVRMESKIILVVEINETNNSKSIGNNS